MYVPSLEVPTLRGRLKSTGCLYSGWRQFKLSFSKSDYGSGELMVLVNSRAVISARISLVKNELVQLPDKGESEADASPEPRVPSRAICTFLRTLSSALKLTGFVMK